MAATPVKIIYQYNFLCREKIYVYCVLCSQNIEKKYRVFDKFGKQGAAYDDAVYFLRMSLLMWKRIVEHI